MRRSKYSVKVRATDEHSPLDEAKYILAIRNSTSEELWHVRRSFAQFCDYYVIILMHLKLQHSCTGSCQLVHDELEVIVRNPIPATSLELVVEYRGFLMETVITQLLQSFAKIPGIRSCSTYIPIKEALRTFLYSSDLATIKLAISPRRYFKLRKVKITDEQRSLSICPICISDWGDTCVVESQCGHIFHSECVSPWFKKSISCPVCRQCVAKTTHFTHSHLIADCDTLSIRGVCTRLQA